MVEVLHKMTTKTESKAVKILVVGDVEGNFDALAKKVEKADKHGPFTALFCVGSFFGESSTLQPYLSGTKKFPIPTYFITGLCF